MSTNGCWYGMVWVTQCHPWRFCSKDGAPWPQSTFSLGKISLRVTPSSHYILYDWTFWLSLNHQSYRNRKRIVPSPWTSLLLANLPFLLICHYLSSSTFLVTPFLTASPSWEYTRYKQKSHVNSALDFDRNSPVQQPLMIDHTLG